MGLSLRVFLVFLSLSADLPAFAETIRIDRLRDKDAIKAEYCRIETGAHWDDCGMPYSTKKLDVIFAPIAMGQRIEAHLRDAFSKRYFSNLDKKDLFHGHFMNRGPGTLYESAKDYFSDVVVSLYHSKEYLANSWQTIPYEESPFVPRDDQRSFIGTFAPGQEGVTAAIDLIRKDLFPEPYPVGFLKLYKMAGTIYTNEINESQRYSLHHYSSFGKSEDLYVKTCLFVENECEPCRIFTTYIMEQSDGRFTSPDGKRFDVTIHCRYPNN